ncbi:MAG: prepilin-type N-terminal cleavage/methylation domain-containing protein [Deltaproteobacteria bacterium]|nr:prepilin-type N-terminal cleavage/methylation domain-containing protein [Deltaproteobacteria bacterium]
MEGLHSLPPADQAKRAFRGGGFTLVEVLLALAILATVLVLLLSTFTGASRGLEILTERSSRFRQIRIAMDRLGADLPGAISSPAVETTAFTCRPDTFSGKPASTLVFTAFALPDTSSARPATDIVKIRYFAKVGGDGKSIDLYREQSDLPLIENKIPTSESRIASGLSGFRVELSSGEKWTADWPSGDAGASKGKLPKRVSFMLADSQGREFKRTITLPLAGQESSILFSGKRPATK